jgi:hypothetical protein
MTAALAGANSDAPMPITERYEPSDNVLSYYKGCRTLRPAGTYTANLDRLRRNVGTRSSHSGAPDPSNGGSPAAGQCRIAVAA